MDDQTTTLQLVAVLVFVVVALGFLMLLQERSLLQIAIDRAIKDKTVIMGMNKDDVMLSWGQPHHVEQHDTTPMGVNASLLIWTYDSPRRTVHFSSDGTVIWVDRESGS